MVGRRRAAPPLVNLLRAFALSQAHSLGSVAVPLRLAGTAKGGREITGPQTLGQIRHVWQGAYWCDRRGGGADRMSAGLCNRVDKHKDRRSRGSTGSTGQIRRTE